MTPRVFTASTWISPSVFWYRVTARLAGTQAMSRSPLMREGVTSSAAPARVKSYSGPSADWGSSLISFTMPMAVGPFRAATRTLTDSSAGVSPSFPPQAARVRHITRARQAARLFFIHCFIFCFLTFLVAAHPPARKRSWP